MILPHHNAWHQPLIPLLWCRVVRNYLDRVGAYLLTSVFHLGTLKA